MSDSRGANSGSPANLAEPALSPKSKLDPNGKPAGGSSAIRVGYGVMFGLAIGFLIAMGFGVLRPIAPPPPPPQQLQMQPALKPDVKTSITWQMASAFQSEIMQLGTGGRRLADLISKLSADELVIRFIEPGGAVAAAKIFEAVQNGDVEAGWALSAYWSDRIPAAAFFSGVPFGPPPSEFLAWLKFGGGQAIYDETYARFGLKGLPCAVLSADASGWFSKEIKTSHDFRGLKVRYYGLGGRVLAKLGAIPTLPGGDVYEALAAGTLDAAEYATPAIDAQHFFDRVAGHYYFPGWHQQATVVELLVNRAKWDALDDRQRLMIAASCGDNLLFTLAESEAAQTRVLAELRTAGVQIHTWSPPLLAEFRKRWLEIVAEESAKDPNFKRAADSLANFRQNYAVWRDLGYL